jgi:hypothetical protein
MDDDDQVPVPRGVKAQPYTTRATAMVALGARSAV